MSFYRLQIVMMAMRFSTTRAINALATRLTPGFRRERASYVQPAESVQDLGLVVSRDSFAFHARLGRLEASTQPSAVFVKWENMRVLARQRVQHAKRDKLQTLRARAQLVVSLVVRERVPTMTTPRVSHARAHSTASRVNAKIVRSRMS